MVFGGVGGDPGWAVAVGGSMTCPICGEVTGLEVGGVPFCVCCESQLRPDRLSYVLMDRPGLFEDWRQLARVFLGWVGFGLLFWAAIYELVFW